MESQILSLITSVLSIIISVFTVLGILVKFSDKILHKAACRAFESIKLEDLDPRSELYRALKQSRDLKTNISDIECRSKTHDQKLTEIVSTVSEISKEMQELKRDRFKADLRSRLEYVIMKKGNVDSIYWDHITEDYDYYTNVLKMNTYMASLYKEGMQLYMKYNVKRESTKEQ